jgi:hypothetical protein
MADTTVTIKLHPSEHRIIVAELTEQAKTLRERVNKETRAARDGLAGMLPAERRTLMGRAHDIEKLLEQL